MAEAVLRHDPHHLSARLIANQAAFIAGDYQAAMALVEAGLARYPHNADLHLRRARCLIVCNEVVAARAALAIAAETARKQGGTGADAAGLWGMIGDAYTLINDFVLALEAYAEAIKREPDTARHHFNHAVVARYMGESQTAAADYAAVLRLQPGHGEAWLNLVQLGRQTAEANRIAAMEEVLARLPPAPAALQARIQLHYALAKSYEDLGQGVKSFTHLDQGSRLMRGSFRYEVGQDLALVEQIISLDLPKPSDARNDGLAQLEPIFVLGLPRSGSTLIERILTSHDAVGSIGESPAFGRALADVAARAGIYPGNGMAFIRAMDGLDPAAIGARYGELTAPWRGEEAYFVDKLPNNHLYAGLIAQALPRARIIHIVRDPLANLYGMYKTLFNQAYPYSYHLDELVAYYAAYCRLMAHWRAMLGPRLIEVRYEELVDAPEAVVRRLVADCGLEWQPACLDFHKNRRPSTTQSASQVRVPLNRDGVIGWRRFEALLAPLQARIAKVAAGLG